MEGTARAGQGGLMGSDIPAMPRGCSGTGGCRELLLLPQSSASCPHSGGCSPSTLPSPFCWRDVCQVDTTGVVPQSASGTPECSGSCCSSQPPRDGDFLSCPAKTFVPRCQSTCSRSGVPSAGSQMLPVPLFCPLCSGAALASDILWPFRCVPYLLWLVPAFLSLLQKKSCDNFVSPFSPDLPMGTQAKAFIFSQAIHT